MVICRAHLGSDEGKSLFEVPNWFSSPSIHEDCSTALRRLEKSIVFENLNAVGVWEEKERKNDLHQLAFSDRDLTRHHQHWVGPIAVSTPFQQRPGHGRSVHLKSRRDGLDGCEGGVGRKLRSDDHLLRESFGCRLWRNHSQKKHARPLC